MARPPDIGALRVAAQRVAATTFTAPEQVVAWLGAVQAQDYLGSLWAVGLRLERAVEADVERAIAERRIVRTWPMRGTLHFVAAADARWMTELLAPRMIARAARRHRELAIDDATAARAHRALVARLEGGRLVTRPEAYETLERSGVSPAGQRGIHLLALLAQRCVLCFGPRAGKQQTFALFDEWLPRARRLPRDEALGELARRYFTSHGPATVRDFTWWTGLATADARLALGMVERGLERFDAGGATYWVAPRSKPTRRTRAQADAQLLPAFDELLVGYAERAAMLAEPHRRRVNAGGGMLAPTILLGHRVAGTWKRSFARGEVVFSPSPFSKLSPKAAMAVARAFRRYAAFVGVEPAAARR